jgi:hypothetical protein
MLYMTTSAAPSSRLDRFVDLLLDKNHPFWKDERQRAVYNEASAAALVLQTVLMVFIGSVGILIGGVKVLGLVTAILLCTTVGQFLIMAILTRRHVDLFPTGWQNQTSRNRKLFSFALVGMYAGSALSVMISNGKDWNVSTAFGTVVGGLVGGGLSLAAITYFKRKMSR